MSHHHHEKPEPEKLDLSRIAPLDKGFLVVGILGLLVTLVMGMSQPRQLAFSWLFAFSACYTVCAGSLFWVLLHHAVDARWSVVVRRILENLASLFPFLMLAFIPLLLLAPELWKWMTMEPGEDVLLDHKAGYLNEPFFYARAIFYFAYFAVASFLLKSISVGQDSDGNPYRTLNMRKLSYGGLVLFGLSITFSGFDWLMGLDYHWFSTMWGVYIFAGSILSAMAVLVLISNGLKAAGYLKVMSEEHNHIMGKLLFAFTVFWAYIAFSQYFLYYYANIPEETSFYIDRNHGSWFYVSVLLVVGHFIIPFLWLITQPAKRTPWRICVGAVWVLLMHLVDLFWIIMPAMAKFSREGATGEVSIHLLDITSLVGLAGVLGYIFLRRLSETNLYPLQDPRLQDSIHLKN